MLTAIQSTVMACTSSDFSATTHGVTRCEPTLQDLLTDPIVKLVMARDGVTERDIQDAFALPSRDF